MKFILIKGHHMALLRLVMLSLFWIAGTAHAQMPAAEMVKLSTGSEVAVWIMKPETLSRQTPILYLHGGPGMYTTPNAIEKSASLRAAGFTTIYFDQPGGGKSKRLAASDYTIDRVIADIEALRQSLGHEKLIVWGNSYGAALATLYATRYPSYTAGIILTSPGSYPDTVAARDYGITNEGKIQYSKGLKKAVSLIDSKGAAAEAKLSQDEAGRLFDEAVNAEMMGRMVCKGEQLQSPLPGSGANLYANRMLSKSLDKTPFKLDALPKMPALIIRGSCDFLVPENAARFGKLFGVAVATIANSGHGLLENPEAFNSALSKFAAESLQGIP
jgi:pimeloyl-ACP methyl ester carboxylesterase